MTLFLFEVVLIRKKSSGRVVDEKGRGRRAGKSSSGGRETASREEVVSRRSGKSVVRRKGFDIGDLAEKYFDHLYAYLGLETLGIDRFLARRVIEDVLDLLYHDASSKPALDAVLRKIDRFKQEVLGFVAYRLACELREFNSDVLEFIIYNGGRYIVGEVSNLYRIATRIGREDLIPYLASIWEKFGSAMPVKCPKCGFKSINPDQYCVVCGYVVTEEYIRSELGFDEKFRAFISYASEKDLQDIKNMGVVLVSDNHVLNPRSVDVYRFSSSRVMYRVNLRKSDYLLIDEEINRRRAST